MANRGSPIVVSVLHHSARCSDHHLREGIPAAFAIERDQSNAALDHVAVDIDAAVVKEAETLTAIEAVPDCFGERGWYVI